MDAIRVTIYERRDAHGQRFYTFDPSGDKVGRFLLPDTDRASFELRDTDYGAVMMATTAECDFPVVPKRAGNGRFYVTPADVGTDLRVGWMKRI